MALAVVATFVVLRYVLGLSALWLATGPGFDDSRFDELQTRFDRERAAFVQARDRMRELVAAHPRAVEIGWTSHSICVYDAPGRPVGPSETVDPSEDCAPVSRRDRATFAALPPPIYQVVYLARDDERTFFRSHHEDPPTYTVMHAPEGTDPRAYARSRGFRSSRALEPGWTVLGPITDLERENAQWR